mmetsp:Transcript_28049/g.71482  ORF Transcript_28049/g.71482 Transcript_28049/m.71482 type:complete len:299 (-) Transcript_28049:1687-2583(-)
MSDGKLVKFRSFCQHREEVFKSGGLFQLFVKHAHCLVLKVVKRCNPAQWCGLHLHLPSVHLPSIPSHLLFIVVNENAPRLLQLRQGVVDKVSQVGEHGGIRCLIEVVVSRVLQKAAEKIRPRYVVECVSLLLYTTRRNLRIDMVMQAVHQAGFDGEGLVQKFAIKALLRILHQYNCLTQIIELRPPCSSHHLQHISDGVVNVSLCLSVVVLRALYNNEMGREIYTPRECRSGYEYLYFTLHEEPFHQLFVAIDKTSVVKADAVRERVLQACVSHTVEKGRELLARHAQKARSSPILLA